MPATYACRLLVHRADGSCVCHGLWKLSFVVLLAGLTGCSGSAGTSPVTGTVKYSNNQPLAGGRVILVPTEPDQNPTRGIIADDGTFHVRSPQGGEGIPPGTYKVLVYPAIPEEALDDVALIDRYKSAVPRQYRNAQTTPLEVAVKENGSDNYFDLVLEPARSR